MKRTLLLVVASALVVSMAYAADSDNWTVTYAVDAQPLVTGSVVTYTVNLLDNHNQPAPVDTYNWQYIGCMNLLSFTNNGQASTSATEVIPGTYLVQCTISYAQGSDPCVPPPADEVPTTFITIPSPTAFRVASGLDSPTSNNASVTVAYRIQCGANDSKNNTGLAQEKIINKTFWDPSTSQWVAQPDDIDWTPTSPAATFYLSGPQIFDIKSIAVNDATWNAIPVGQTFYKMTQKNQLVLTDYCNKQQTYDLGSKDLQRTKISDTEWQLEAQ